MIVTARMRLAPASVVLARAELTDRAEFARLPGRNRLLGSAPLPRPGVRHRNGPCFDRLFAQPGVARTVAETAEDNIPSVRLLSRLGFVRTEPAVEPGHIRLVLNRRADADKDSI